MLERQAVEQRIKEGARSSRTRAERIKDIDTYAMKMAAEVQRANEAGRKLAKEIMEDFMLVFAAAAARVQPRDGNANANAADFEKWSRLAVETAARLAPYQSPTFRAIMITPPPDPSRGVRKFTLNIFDHGGNRVKVIDASPAPPEPAE